MVRGWPGHKWAKPSLTHLRHLLRHCVENPGEVRAKGLQARRDMISKYSFAVMAVNLEYELQRIVKLFRSDEL